MPSLLVRTLEAWRNAERLLEVLPPTAPDHKTVARLVVQLRETYGRLAEASTTSRRSIESSQETLDQARGVLDAVTRGHRAARLSPGPPEAALARRQ